jgi:hypothetical protein
MKRRAITGIRMRRQKISRLLHQLKVEDQALLHEMEEDEKVRAKALTMQQLSTLLAEEGIELRGGRLFVPLAWVAVTRRPSVKQSLALIPRAR